MLAKETNDTINFGGSESLGGHISDNFSEVSHGLLSTSVGQLEEDLVTCLWLRVTEVH